jgi:amino acid transporter
MLTCGALPVLRRRPDVPAPVFRMPAGTLVALLGVALCVWLLSNTSLQEARDAALVLMGGLAIYSFCAVRRQ